jgi:hypothetical protein
MIELVCRDDLNPICPHCDSDIRSIWFRELTGVLGRRYLYFCGACNRVLGVSHRKGFFMG